MENQQTNPVAEESSAIQKVLETRDLIHREIYRLHGLNPGYSRAGQGWPKVSTLPEGVVQLGEVVEYYLFTISKAWAFTQGTGSGSVPAGVIEGKAKS